MQTQPAVAFLNQRFLPLNEVTISPLDRGFLFADGVYEVIPAYNGRLFRSQEHIQRLANSLAEIKLPLERDWERLLTELVQQNGGGDLAVYLQVTRGAPPQRDHAFPVEAPEPTVFAMAKPIQPQSDGVLRQGLTAATVEDIRWGKCHIKTVALLANVLARQDAVEQGCDDAILVRDGAITEASAGNVFLLKDGVIHTAPKDHRILHGITRQVILELAAASQIQVAEDELPVAMLAQVEEVWISSSTKEVLPVTKIDARPVGNGEPGPVWQRMWELYQAYKRQICG